MKSILVTLASLIALAVCGADTNDFPVVKINGRTLTNVFVSYFNATDAWLYQRSGGGGRFKLSDLPPEVQARCHYDPSAEAKFNEQAAAAAEKARALAAARPIVNAINDKIKMEFDPIRETLTWEPKEPIHVFSNVFRVGFFAVFLKEDIKFATNGPKLNAKPIRKPDAITMTLSSESGEWQFLNFHDFTVVYDGQRKDFRDLEHHGDVFAGGVSEAFFPEFTYAEFRALSLAKSVKAELGDLPFDLSYKDRETMRAFVNYFDLEFKSTLNDSALPP